MKIILKIAAFLVIVYFSSGAVQSQWINIGAVSGTGANFPGVSVVNDNVVWFAGGNGGTPVLYRSTNGGTNIVSVNPPPCFELTCVWGISADTCFAGDGGSSGSAGGNAKLFRTTNAGVNWVLINQTGGSAGFFNDIVYSKVNPLDGIAVSNAPGGTGQQFYLLKTTNGGNNWTVENPPGVSGAQGVWHCAFIYSAEAYGFSLTGGIIPRLYGTTDFGTSWTALPVIIPGGTITSFAFSDINTIALAGNASIVARNTDQGLTWQTVNNGGALCIRWITGTNQCYFMSSGIIKKSTDEGVTWNSMTIAGVSGLKHFDLVKFNGNVYGYAITSTGVIIKLTDNITGIKRIDENIPQQFSLSQNFPNPFNPETKIVFSIPPVGNGRDRSVRLIVYDNLGRVVRTLVNEELQPGKYEVNFNGSGYSSGVYYYKLVAGDYINTKKMLLIK
jgi:photosystem II stability/assembly factor-like uncharacterized protein